MSAAHDTHGHDHGHDHAHGHAEVAHGTLGDYVKGFALSVVLTAIPFWLVITNALGSHGLTALIIVIFAAVQIVVHMVYFLHMTPRAEGGWNMLALIFTAIVLLIVLTGSFWVMHNLNANMMPHAHVSTADLP